MTQRGKLIRLGIFVVAALVSLATLVVVFGKRPTSFFTNRLNYNAWFDNAPGIQKGTPVRRSGVNIGEVDRVTLDESGRVLVVLKIDRQFRPRENEVPAIAMALLTGDSIVEMIPDPAKRDQPLGKPIDPDPDKPLQGRAPLTPRDVGQRAEPLLDVSQQALEEIKKAFKEFNKVAPDMRDALRESSATLSTVREAVPELKRTNDNLHGLITQARQAMPQLERTNNAAQKTLAEWNQAGEQLKLLIAENKDKVDKTITRINSALDSATKSFDKANQLLNDENIKNVNATLAKLPQLTDSGDQLMKDASAGVKRLNQTAEKIETAVENIRRTTQSFADRSEPILRNVQEGSEQFKQLVAESRMLLQHFARSDGTIARLFNDPALYNNANDSVLMLVRMAPRLELVLHNLETFSDKIARHPEQLGVRGAIKPDAGLKGSPHAPLPSLAPANPWALPKY